jgi:hypothetical protein
MVIQNMVGRARLREEWPRAWQPIKPGERRSLGPAGSWGPSACATDSPPLLGRVASGGCGRGDCGGARGAEPRAADGVTADDTRQATWAARRACHDPVA